MVSGAEDVPSEDLDRPSGGAMPLRVVTAAAIFDGHDAAIGIFRRILQSQGCEVIHLGHDRGAEEVAMAAIQEDAHAIAITSYQGGAVEMFTHTKEILESAGFGHVFLFGGGGGTILPHEISHLREKAVARTGHQLSQLIAQGAVPIQTAFHINLAQRRFGLSRHV